MIRRWRRRCSWGDCLHRDSEARGLAKPCLASGLLLGIPSGERGGRRRRAKTSSIAVVGWGEKLFAIRQ